MTVGSGPSIQTQLYSMKKATKIQEQMMDQILKSSTQQMQQIQNTQQTQKSSTASLTGMGVSLDVKA